MEATLRRIRDRRARDDSGFTLIELLVVVVIIGVLVAIAIPVYLNYREGAADKSAQSDVRGAISALEQFYTSQGNKYPDSATNATAPGTNIPLVLGATAPGDKITVSEGTILKYVRSVDLKTYVICAANNGGSGKVYRYASTDGGSVKEAAAGVTVAACA